MKEFQHGKYWRQVYDDGTIFDSMPLPEHLSRLMTPSLAPKGLEHSSIVMMDFGTTPPTLVDVLSIIE